MAANFGRRVVLRNIDVVFETGLTTIIGPNGSGKSTLLRCLAQLHSRWTGSITYSWLDGAASASVRRRGIGYLPQQASHLRSFTLRESLRYSGWLMRMPRVLVDQRCDQLVEEFDLSGGADRKLKQLSGGTRQRAYLATALIHDPRLLLLDEPTTGIDAEHRVAFRQLVGELARTRVVIMSTHLTEDVELLADRVVGLSSGAVSFAGSVPELLTLADPATGINGARRIEVAMQRASAR